MKTAYGLFIALSLLSTNALAALSAEQQQEITHLIDFIRSAPCSIERNGKRYQGAEATKHILKKQTYFKKKIDSAESFIRYSATKSELSGRPYMAYCAGEPPLASKTWLLRELERYRKKRQH